MMPMAHRARWLMAAITQRKQVNVLETEFVDDYVKATGAPYQVTPFGANKCSTLGRDLGRMWSRRELSRYTVALPYDLAGCMGFPKWVYMYEVAK